MVTLKDVIDNRTGEFHHIAVVNERKARYFVPSTEEQNTRGKAMVTLHEVIDTRIEKHHGIAIAGEKKAHFLVPAETGE